jgi:hypothetical protein
MPTAAENFHTFMTTEVWQDKCTPTIDGGIHATVSDLYDEWHDAVQSATLKGASRGGPTTFQNEKGWRYYTFHDGSRIRINYRGSALLPPSSSRPVRRPIYDEASA